MSTSLLGYWSWFIRGSGGNPGFRRILNWWLSLHLLVGVILSFVVPVDLQTAANAVLLPLAGILIGLSFAWAGNAQVLLQSSEIEQLSKHHKGGFIEYVFTYQTAILVILVTLVLWGLAGFGIYDLTWPTRNYFSGYLIVEIILFSFCSLTIRECWHVVLSAQWMLIVRREIRHKKHNK